MRCNGSLLVVEKHHSRFGLVHNNVPARYRFEDLNINGESKLYFFYCNGIICVADLHKVELWNPATATRQCKTSPRSHKEAPSGFSGHGYPLGLSFDPIANEYKVVKLWMFRRSEEEYVNKVEVWTLGEDTWKEIDIKLEVWTPHGKDKWRQIDSPMIPRPHVSPPIELKGKLYWRGFYLKKNVMVYYDIVREMFRVVPLPDSQCFPLNDYYNCVKLATMNESLAVFSNPLNHNAQCFEIWLFGEESDHVSWSKYMTVELPPGPINGIPTKTKMFPMGFWKNGEELVLFDECYGRLLFFNMSTSQIVYSGLMIHSLQDAIFVYNANLVSI